MVTSFSGGRSRSTRREPPTMGKQLIEFNEAYAEKKKVCKEEMFQHPAQFTTYDVSTEIHDLKLKRHVTW